MDPDLVVIGGGAAGLGAARWARRSKASVILVERDRIGGDCTFTGCVPSKALIEAAGRGDAFTAAMAAAGRAVEQIAAGETAEAIRTEGIGVITGQACFLDRGTLDIDGRRMRPKAIVIATGAGPAVPPVPGLDTVDYLTNETVFDLDRLPASLAVLGGGPVGVELAQAFARLGSEVTVIETAGHLLPKDEPEAALVVEATLGRLGAAVRTGRQVVGVSRDETGQVRLELSDASTVTADAVLVAAGRTPVTAGLGLDAAGVDLDDHGRIEVDARMRTTAKGVFAAGDVAQSLQFTHVAYQTGLIAAANALAPIPFLRFNPQHVPWVTFTRPEVARVGMTEAEAARTGARVAYLPMTEVDRAIAAGRTDGFVKIIAAPRLLSRHTVGGRIVGATIVAERAGEMISEVVLAMRAHMLPARLALTTHAYPTWSTAVQQAAAQLFGEFGGRTWRGATCDTGRHLDRPVTESRPTSTATAGEP